jgi:hypothetical protein
MHSRKKRRRGFCVARGNTAPALEMQKGVFHQVPQFVEFFVIVSLLLSVLSRRYLRLHALFNGLLYDGITVVSFVCQQVLCRYALDQFASLRAICNGTCRDKYSDWHTMRIHGQMQLRIEPPFVVAIS